jgi:hypothetical protein
MRRALEAAGGCILIGAGRPGAPTARLPLLLAISLVLTSATVLAAESESASGLTRVAFIGADTQGQGTANVDPVADLVAGEVRKHPGYEVIGVSEAARAVLSSEPPGDCLKDRRCRTSLAHTIRADTLITASLEPKRHGFRLALTIIDVHGRASRTTESMRHVESLGMNVRMCLDRLLSWNEPATAAPALAAPVVPAPAVSASVAGIKTPPSQPVSSAASTAEAIPGVTRVAFIAPDAQGHGAQSVDRLADAVAAEVRKHSGYGVIAVGEAARAVLSSAPPGDCLQDRACRKSLAHTLRADALITGSLEPRGHGFRLALRVIDVRGRATRTTEFMRHSENLAMNVQLCLDRLLSWNEPSAAAPTLVAPALAAPAAAAPALAAPAVPAPAASTPVAATAKPAGPASSEAPIKVLAASVVTSSSDEAPSPEERRQNYLGCVSTNSVCLNGTSAWCKPDVPPTPYSHGSAFQAALGEAQSCHSEDDVSWAGKCSQAVRDHIPDEMVQRFTESLNRLRDRFSALPDRFQDQCGPLPENFGGERIEATHVWCGSKQRDCVDELTKDVQLLKDADNLESCVYTVEFAIQRNKLARDRIAQCERWSGYQAPASEIETDMVAPPAPSPAKNGPPDWPRPVLETHAESQ